MVHTCEFCGNDFLTEADPYIVAPFSTGKKLYCFCKIDKDRSDLSKHKRALEVAMGWINHMALDQWQIDGVKKEIEEILK